MIKTDQSVLLDRWRSKSWLSLAIILFAPVIIVIDIFIVNVTLPTIKDYYHTTDAYVQLVVAAYLIGYTVFLITGSRAGDHYGRKKVYYAGLLAFTVASALCGWSASIHQLVFFRFLQGVSAAFAAPQTYTLIQLYFPEQQRRDKAFGYYGIASGFAAVLGQLLGGYFITSQLITDSWRLIFLINLPVGIIATAMALLFLRESREQHRQKFDLPGVLLLTVALAALIYPVTRGRELGWPAWSLYMIAGALVLLFLFVKDQQRKARLGKALLVNTDLFSIKSFNIGILCAVFFFGVHTGFLLDCAIFLQNGCGFSPQASSYFFTVFGVGFMLSAYWSIRNAARYGVRMLQAGCVLMILSFAGQMAFFRPAPAPVVIALLLLVYGIGNGLVLPSILNVSLRRIGPTLAGTASGVYSTIQQFASALGVSILGGVFLSLLQQAPQHYHHAYAVAVGCMAVYLGIVILLLNRLQPATGAGARDRTAVTAGYAD